MAAIFLETSRNMVSEIARNRRSNLIRLFEDLPINWFDASEGEQTFPLNWSLQERPEQNV